jgi:peroxiredoxin
MVKTVSTMLPLGTQSPDFTLVNVDGTSVSLSQFSGAPALVIAFMCNHCPFVKHLADTFAQFGHECQSMGVAVVGISSNDVSNFPADSPEQMVHEAEQRGYTFPYLSDETQEIAKAYRAACTPDFYVFDKNQKLAYRGQFDSSRPDGDIPVSGDDLRRAVKAIAAGEPAPEPQVPSLGCNIKWKSDSEPDYFNPSGTG